MGLGHNYLVLLVVGMELCFRHHNLHVKNSDNRLGMDMVLHGSNRLEGRCRLDTVQHTTHPLMFGRFHSDQFELRLLQNHIFCICDIHRRCLFPATGLQNHIYLECRIGMSIHLYRVYQDTDIFAMCRRNRRGGLSDHMGLGNNIPFRILGQYNNMRHLHLSGKVYHHTPDCNHRRKR